MGNCWRERESEEEEEIAKGNSKKIEKWEGALIYIHFMPTMVFLKMETLNDLFKLKKKN